MSEAPKRKLIIMKGQDERIDQLMADLEVRRKETAEQLKFFNQKVEQLSKSENKKKRQIWEEVRERLQELDKIPMSYEDTNEEHMEWDDENGMLWLTKKEKNDIGKILGALIGKGINPFE